MAPYPLADARGEAGALAVGAHHDLERAVAVHAAEVEVALGGDVGDVGGDAMFLAELPYLGRRGGVVDGDEDHVGRGVCGRERLEIGRSEHAVHVGNLAIVDAVTHLRVEAGRRAHDDDAGVSVEDVEDPAGGDLDRR